MKRDDCCPDCKRGVEEGRAELATLAEALANSSEKVAAMSAERAASRPAVKYITKTIDHEEKFECGGEEGEVVDVSRVSGMLFRGEKLIAIDDHDPVGYGTVIEAFSVGDKPQMPPQGFSTAFFLHNSLGCGIKFDTAKPGDRVSFRVKFLKRGTWRAVLFGRAVPAAPKETP